MSRAFGGVLSFSCLREFVDIICEYPSFLDGVGLRLTG